MLPNLLKRLNLFKADKQNASPIRAEQGAPVISTESMPEGFIARHATEGGTARFTGMLADMRERIHKARRDLPHAPDSAMKIYTYSLYEAGLLQMLEPDSPVIVDALRRAARAMAACCTLISKGTGAVVLDIMDAPLVTPRVAKNTFVYVNPFINGMFAALASGDEASLATLARIDVDTLTVLGKHPPYYLEFLYARARALQGFCLGADGAVGAYVNALAQLRLRDEKVDNPETEVYSAEADMLIATGLDPATFNTALSRALEGHRRDCESSPAPNVAPSFIALGPMAFAAQVAERGWPITVQSDYLPLSVLAPAAPRH